MSPFGTGRPPLSYISSVQGMSLPRVERRLIIARGIVQGVGFRPFVFRLATHLFLKGYVQNDTHGVSIDVEGEREHLDRFINSMLDSPPPQALIEELHWQDLSPLGYTTFEIKDSPYQADPTHKEALVAPDIATCEECLKEFFDPANRRYLYPFINCSHCGPRYTIARDIPYDRVNTTMDAFIMCQDCSGEYHDPQDRRFHAQPNACHRCGPQLRLLDCRGNELPGDVLEQTVSLLKDGRILAIKGIGGYHLAVDATQSHVVSELRNRKRRWGKPFALMARDLEVARGVCRITPQEAQLLLSAKRPIVLLEKRQGSKVAEGVAPGCKELGIMLPYTPLHHYLLRYAGDLLVMTSGNVTDEPILFEDSEALIRLKDVADYFLVSNRPIFTRCDDSVVRVNPEFGMRNIPSAEWGVENAELKQLRNPQSELRICNTPHSARGTHSAILIRRARGYAPYPLRLASPFGKNVLACGAMLKNTFCIGKRRHAFLSPHIGDLENLETLEAFQQGIERFKKMLYLEPDIVSYDMHPDYLSTQYALGLKEGVSKIPVQHHHAHVVSCMAENGLEGEVIGVAFDGLGYGEDGHLWGGEFLLASPQGYRRMGHLEYVPMPGGQKAIKEPWRMALSYLYYLSGEDFLKTNIEFVRRLDKGKWPTVKEMMDNKINSPLTSSMGRLFDGVSALLGIRRVITYEGQAAVELEQIADEGSDTSYPFELREAVGAQLGCGILNILNAECGMQNAELNSALRTPHSALHIGWHGLFKGILKDLYKGTPIPKISSRFHYSVALMTGEVCKRIRGASGQKRVVLSGGVFQNVLLLRLCEGILGREGFDVYIHHKVPTNDGGLSLGQAVIADRRQN